MVRVFEEVEITHVEGDLDPIRDLEIIFSELILKDLQVVNNLIDRYTTLLNKGQDKSKKPDLEILQKVKEHLEEGKQVRCGQWSGKEIDLLNTIQLITAKPAMFLVNMSENDYARQRNKWLKKLKDWIDEQTGEPMIRFCGARNELPQHVAGGSSQVLRRKQTKSQIHKINHHGVRYHQLDSLLYRWSW
ncbi:hypothetical protein AGDE_11466 [Angomonas deanei]|nr:hypothetical protein AGDE_11466 [Angomonas deanei]|eukprot:EPY26248.1 hypothetical protein AGDE_11466 [Angomonas deanei]